MANLVKFFDERSNAAHTSSVLQASNPKETGEERESCSNDGSAPSSDIRIVPDSSCKKRCDQGDCEDFDVQKPGKAEACGSNGCADEDDHQLNSPPGIEEIVTMASKDSPKHSPKSCSLQEIEDLSSFTGENTHIRSRGFDENLAHQQQQAQLDRRQQAVSQDQPNKLLSKPTLRISLGFFGLGSMIQGRN